MNNNHMENKYRLFDIFPDTRLFQSRQSYYKSCSLQLHSNPAARWLYETWKNACRDWRIQGFLNRLHAATRALWMKNIRADRIQENRANRFPVFLPDWPSPKLSPDSPDYHLP